MLMLAQTPRVISITDNVRPEIPFYDSLRNVRQYVNLSLDFSELVGQELVFLENRFWNDKERYPIAVYTDLTNNVSYDCDEVYYPSIEGYSLYTLYIGLAGKTLKIKDFIYPKTVTSSMSGYLVLEGPPIHPNLYIECVAALSDLPCVIKGYDKKLRDIYISERYIPIHPLEVTNLIDNSKRIFSNSDTLKCVDVAYSDDKDFSELLILRDNADSLYYAHKVSVDLWCMSLSKLKESEAAKHSDLLYREQKMCSKYGERIGRIIARGTVKIGFTKEQCIDAWGEPNSINITTTRYSVNEQWVYDNKFLYFQNGKLSAIQQ